MKLNKLKVIAFLLSVCLISIAVSSCGQSKTGNIENLTPLATPKVAKGYYSIYNNNQKLNSSAGRLIFSGKPGEVDKSDRNISGGPKKGYYSIGKNTERNRVQMTKEGIDFSGETPARVIQNNAFPVIRKGYYSIGNNVEKLQK